MSNRTDLRVVKTRKAIRGAFLGLLTEKDYAAITVQDILDRALINRKTFYNHYHDKRDLLLQLGAEANGIMQYAFDRRMDDRTGSSGFWSLVNTTYAQLYEDRELFLALWHVRAEGLDLVADLSRNMHDAYLGLATGSPSTQAEREFQAKLWAALAMEALHDLLASGRPFDAHWVHDQIDEMLETAAGATDR